MNDGSVTHWIERVKDGTEGAAQQELWDRYFSRLVALARQQMNDLPPHIRDDENLALSALNTFFVRVQRGCFPQLHDRSDLWALLAKITVRKSIDQRRYIQAQKRGLDRMQGDSVFHQNPMGIVEIRDEPTPDMLAAVNEKCQQLMSALPDDLRQVAQMKLEGYTHREIAEKLGRVERTVERKLEVIRRTWCRGEDSL